MLSVGIDIGTSTTQLIISRLTIENRAAAFTVPRFSITGKEILYQSAVHFTPLLSDTVIDTDGIRKIVDTEYRDSGIDRSTIQSGAVIITGETARKENAREVLSALSGYAGDFVVATAGPDLESVLAAKGAGIDQYSEENACCVLNFDIGGGTSNLALYCNGSLQDAGCMNVGGRLIKLSKDSVITYLSPVLKGRFPLSVGQAASQDVLMPVIRELVQALEEAAGLREKTEVFEHYLTSSGVFLHSQPVFSFSGGVADLIFTDSPPDWLKYGDIGVLLGQAIRSSALCDAPHICGKETIRATVIGAGAHTTDVSGSTICYEGAELPIKNLPVISVADAENAAHTLAETIRERLQWHMEDGKYSPVLFAIRGQKSPGFSQLQELASTILQGTQDYLRSGLPLYLAVEHDFAKALGQCILAQLPNPHPFICMDSLRLQTGQYLDIGRPIAGGAVLPVVIKTLIFTA